MKFGWRKNNDGSRTLGEWTVKKEWESDLWEVYRGHLFMAGGLVSELAAMEQTERMMTYTIVENKKG